MAASELELEVHLGYPPQSFCRMRSSFSSQLILLTRNCRNRTLPTSFMFAAKYCEGKKNVDSDISDSTQWAYSSRELIREKSRAIGGEGSSCMKPLDESDK